MHRRELILGLGALGALAACQRQQQKAEAPQDAADAGAAGRAITDPAPVVRQVYDPYLVADGQSPSLVDAAPWSAAMLANLATLRTRSEASESPILDFDPLIDAQDYDLADVTATTEGLVENSHATVRASFSNFGQRKEVVYDLVWEDDRWKVDNVRSAQWDLRQIATGG